MNNPEKNGKIEKKNNNMGREKFEENIMEKERKEKQFEKKNVPIILVQFIINFVLFLVYF